VETTVVGLDRLVAPMSENLELKQSFRRVDDPYSGTPESA